MTKVDTKTGDGAGSTRTILDIIARITDMGFVGVARVTEESWTATCVRDTGSFGIGVGDQLTLGQTICSDVRALSSPIIIDDAQTSPEFQNHPAVEKFGLRSYFSYPIVQRDGSIFGTLCGIDPAPRALSSPEIQEMLAMFAQVIANGLDGEDRTLRSEQALALEEETSLLREEFIAILGHDLRSPASSIISGTRMLMQEDQTPRSRRILSLIQASATRMSEMIANMMDFARGRLGHGIELERAPNGPIAEDLLQVVEENRLISPVPIEVEFKIEQPVSYDRQRIGQLVSNLLGNALSYGEKGAPVYLQAGTIDGTFRLDVINRGTPIPDSIRETLFDPFSRTESQPGNTGLGLGLYIASEIAAAHGGRITVASDETETRFTLTMPV